VRCGRHAGRASSVWFGRTDRESAHRGGFARVRDCASGHEIKSDSRTPPVSRSRGVLTG
jgi:hypothetical protein